MATDFVCTICMEIFHCEDEIFSTICGHLYHMYCLQQWRRRSTKCPECRKENPQPHRIYLHFEEVNRGDITELNKKLMAQNKKQTAEIENQKYILHCKTELIAEQRKENGKLQRLVCQLSEELQKEKEKFQCSQESLQVSEDDLYDNNGFHFLFAYAKQHLKPLGWKFIWVNRGKVFGRPNKQSAPIFIRNKRQVDQMAY